MTGTKRETNRREGRKKVQDEELAQTAFPSMLNAANIKIAIPLNLSRTPSTALDRSAVRIRSKRIRATANLVSIPIANHVAVGRVNRGTTVLERVIAVAFTGIFESSEGISS